MYQILHGSPERPWALSPWPSGIEGLNPGIRLCPAPEGVLLHLRENRSHLSERGRQAVAAIVFVWLACTILPALKGLWPVAAYSLAVMTALLVALGCHARSRPASETLTFAGARIRHRNASGQTAELPSRLVRLHIDEPAPAELHLFLRHGATSVEIARCIGIDERRALITTLAALLAQAREGRQCPCTRISSACAAPVNWHGS